jgi:hypothetical protein
VVVVAILAKGRSNLHVIVRIPGSGIIRDTVLATLYLIYAGDEGDLAFLAA